MNHSPPRHIQMLRGDAGDRTQILQVAGRVQGGSEAGDAPCRGDDGRRRWVGETRR